MLEQCCHYSKQCRNNVATLCCAKNRRCESSRVTSPLNTRIENANKTEKKLLKGIVLFQSYVKLLLNEKANDTKTGRKVPKM